MNSFAGSLLKGRMAEEMVSLLFRQMGFPVIRHGYEYSNPGVQVLRDLNRIRKVENLPYKDIPDFFIGHRDELDRRSGELVEVKFRSKSKVKLDPPGHYPADVHFLLVDRTAIWSASHEELREVAERDWVQMSDLRRLEADHWFGFMPADKKFLRDNIPKMVRCFDGFFSDASARPAKRDISWPEISEEHID